LLKCSVGYWANSESINYPNSSINGQKCTSVNCKTYDYEKEIFTNAQLNKPCKECWDKNDLSWTSNKDIMIKYENWDAMSNYKWEELSGRDLDNPFVKKTKFVDNYEVKTADICELNCKVGFWQDYKDCNGEFV